VASASEVLEVIDETLRALERQYQNDPRNEAVRERLQRAWVRTGRGWHGESLSNALRVAQERGVYVYSPRARLELELVFVPPFTVPSTRPSKARPTQRIGGFYIGRYPVTWRQHLAFCEEHSSHDVERPVPKLPKWWEGRFLTDPEDRKAIDVHPVVNVSLAEARAFCAWASLELPSADDWNLAAFGRDPRVVCPSCEGTGFNGSKRAPENTCHACHGTGGPRRRYPWGNQAPAAHRCVSSEHPLYGGKSTAPVVHGTTPDRPASASQFGAIDMLGNVCEFLETGEVGSWSSFRISSKGLARRPEGDPRKHSVARGHNPADDVGFRVVLRTSRGNEDHQPSRGHGRRGVR